MNLTVQEVYDALMLDPEYADQSEELKSFMYDLLAHLLETIEEIMAQKITLAGVVEAQVGSIRFLLETENFTKYVTALLPDIGSKEEKALANLRELLCEALEELEGQQRHLEEMLIEQGITEAYVISTLLHPNPKLMQRYQQEGVTYEEVLRESPNLLVPKFNA